MKLSNLLLLIGGYGLGQGGVFVAQTWLIMGGHLNLLADFGVNFYMGMMGIMLVDFGSTAVLARETAANEQLRADARSGLSIWTNYWAITPARVVMAIVVLLTAITAVTFVGDSFSRAFALFACPALFIWAFNATGLLDGLRLSGMNGLTGALPFVVSAVAMASVVDQPPAAAGKILGAAFTFGYLLAVAGQILAIRRAGHEPRWARPTQPLLIELTRSGVGSLLAILPGQVYFRIQILLAGLLIGGASVAMFLYAKQVTTGFGQLTAFMRRIEFPDLVQRLRTHQKDRIRTILFTQWAGTTSAAVFAIVMIACGLITSQLVDGPTVNAALTIALFGPSIFTGALAQSFTQGLFALSAYAAASIVTIAASIFALASIILLGPQFHLAAFAAADIIASFLIITLASWALSCRTISKNVE